MISPAQNSNKMAISTKNLTGVGLLDNSWRSVRRGKNKKIAESSRGIDKVTLSQYEENLSNNLKGLKEKLEKKLYFPKPIKVRLVEKENTEPKEYRPICIPTVEDRIVQRALLEVGYPYLRNKIDSDVNYCGTRKNDNDSKNSRSAVKAIISSIKSGNYFIFESDISKFYDTIPKKRLFKVVCKILKPDTYVKKILRSCIYFKTGNPKLLSDFKLPLFNRIKGIPQGNALSPIFANIYLYEFDQKLKKKYGKNYIRYVDDFLIICSSKTEAAEAEKKVRQLIHKLSLKLKEAKTQQVDIRKLKSGAKINFLGLGINAESIGPKQNIKALNKKVHEFFNESEAIKDERYKRKELTVSQIIEEKILSWGEYYKHYHVGETFSKLDEIIKKRKEELHLNMKTLSTIKVTPIISIEEWQKLFN